MFLALRELWFARYRFALMGGVVALIAVLMVLLSGLSVGLVNDGVSGLQRLPVDAFAFDEGTKEDSAFSRSTVDEAQVTTWSERGDVAEAAPFGNLLVNARSSRDVPIDLALFGVEPGSFLDPEVTDGAGLDAPDALVVSQTAIDAGLRIGDTVTIDRIGTTFRVAGTTGDQRTYGHVDVAYLDLEAWQRLHAGAGPGDPVRPEAFEEATAVALRPEPGGSIDLAAGDAAAGTTSLTLEDSFGASPGYTAETSTLTMIRVFLYAISALVVGAFFTVWTIQRRHELAVLRAMGASTGYLMRDGLAQSAIVLLLATATGVLVGVGGGGLIGGGVPFAIDAGSVALAAVALVILGLLGSGVAIVRIARVNPIDALGGNR